jgi:hypothetical protein
MAVEDRKAMARNAIGGVSAFIMVHTFKFLDRLAKRARNPLRQRDGLSRGSCGVPARLMTASSRAPLAPLGQHHKYE